ncbi:MAG TPA: putative metalloprotease CJM1_0395 family protein [Pseudomonas sp.]|nr:putative metalloprotease CJM1_0395 family protein [Pseudomonas sp.]
MHIGGATVYRAPAASLLPARAFASPVSPVPSPVVSSASKSPTQAPLTTPQPLADEQAASSREEADKPAEQSSRSEQAAQDEPSPQQQRLEQLEIAKLSQRDQEVRAHEQAHAAVGGRYAGAPSYTFSHGPDGKRYAVGGEVSIDSGPVPNDPEATLRKMEIVLRAALAPAEPSAQDLRIAAQAQVQIAQARAELNELRRSETAAAREEQAQRAEQAKAEEEAQEKEKPTEADRQDLPPPPSLELYRRLGELQEPTQAIDLVA